jgi:ketosteroid isomerase-like protein
MSQENVESVRRAYEHFNRTHLPSYELLDPRAEWHTAADLPDSSTYRGHHGIAALYSEWVAFFGEGFRADVQEVFDTGDSVVVWCILRGQVRESSEGTIELPEAHVWTFRDQTVVEVREYRNKAEALAAVGLSEQEAHAER